MARKKAEKEVVELSEEEQPYELPEGWKWERLGDINKFKSKNLTPNNFPEEIFELYSVPNFIYDYPEILKGEEIGSSKQIVDKDDVLLCKINPNINRVWAVSKYTNNRMIASGEWIVFRNNEINSRMIKWYFTSPYFRTLMMSNVSGVGGSLTRAKPKLVANYLLPIPPKETQQKIVDIIESLFAKLDIAQEKVEKVLAESDNRRAAILHNAFSGKLTEKWRKENGVSFDSWRKNKIKEVSTPRAGYAFDSKKFCNNGYQVIRMGNLYGGELLLDRSPVYYDENDVDKKILNRALLRDKDIVITLTGTKYKRDYGYAVCLYEPYKLLLNQRCMSLTANEKIIEYRYLLYYLRSNQFRDIFFSNETGGVNQGNVSSKFVENIEITLPLQPEQKEIIRLLDKFLSVEDKVKSTYQNTLEAIATMRKSILAKAFRGELCS